MNSDDGAGATPTRNEFEPATPSRTTLKFIANGANIPVLTSSTPSASVVSTTTTSSGGLNQHLSAKKFGKSGFHATISESPPPITIEGQIQQLRNHLEDSYQIQANVRMNKFVTQFGGQEAPPHEIERFRQKEDIERTKFCVWLEAEVGKQKNKLTRGGRNPFSSPSKNPHKERNPFETSRSFPPSPPRFSRNININSDNMSSHDNMSHDGTSHRSFSSAKSITSAQDHQSMMDHDATEVPLTRDDSTRDDSANAWGGFTREQVVDVFKHVFAKLEDVQAENGSLKTEVTDLKTRIAHIPPRDDQIREVALRLVNLEQQLATINNNRATEVDIATLAGEVNSLKGHGGFLTRRAFNTENELTKLSFNSKCNLIEKTLGIDITTTGPKPHDVLEALHHRLWYIETLLPPGDPANKADKPYQPLSEVMKTTLGSSNRMVNFSATPGYAHGPANTNAHSNLGAHATSHTHASVNANITAGAQFGANPRAWSDTSSIFGAHPPSEFGSDMGGFSPPPTTAGLRNPQVAQQQGKYPVFIDNTHRMNFDPADIRYGGQQSTTFGNSTTAFSNNTPSFSNNSMYLPGGYTANDDGPRATELLRVQAGMHELPRSSSTMPDLTRFGGGVAPRNSKPRARGNSQSSKSHGAPHAHFQDSETTLTPKASTFNFFPVDLAAAANFGFESSKLNAMPKSNFQFGSGGAQNNTTVPFTSDFQPSNKEGPKTSTNKADTGVAPIDTKSNEQATSKELNEAARKAWFNQKPGSFAGVKLQGLGAKDAGT